MAAPSSGGRQPLDGAWTIALDPTNTGRADRWFAAIPAVETEQTTVPGTIQQAFPSRYGVAWYWRSFTPPRQPEVGERVLIRFHAVEYLGEVWLNGRYLGSHEGGETPFSLDATAALQPNENFLAVRIVNPTYTPIDGMMLRQIPHRNKLLAEDFRPGNGLNYGGIVQPVELLVVPALRITDVFARPDSHSGRIDLTLTLRNDSAGPAKVTLHLSAGPATAGSPTTSTVVVLDLPLGEASREATIDIEHHRLWSLEDPYLYRVTVRMEALGPDGATYDHDYTVRCGFRDFRWWTATFA
jgi:beta-galactosidase/beta-glucuronidase